eukprot:gene17002-23280_t
MPPSAERYFPNKLDDSTPLPDGERAEILNALDEAGKDAVLAAGHMDDLSGGGIYVGIGGVLLAIFTSLSNLPTGPMPVEGWSKTDALQWCLDICMALCNSSHMPRPNDMESNYQLYVQKLPPGECEVLYGRAGYLFSLLFLRHHAGPSYVDSSIIKHLVCHIIVEGRKGAETLCQKAVQGVPPYPLMYSWHDSYYLGAITLSVWLVQLCHGAPGHILLCTLLWDRELGSSSGAEHGEWCRAAALKAGQQVWERGILKKGLGLCHGISGNAYALLALYRATGDPTHLHRAQKLALLSARNWRKLYGTPDRPMSLYEGLCGAMCLWSSILAPSGQVSKAGGLPGYELLHTAI